MVPIHDQFLKRNLKIFAYVHVLAIAHVVHSNDSHVLRDTPENKNVFLHNYILGSLGFAICVWIRLRLEACASSSASSVISGGFSPPIILIRLCRFIQVSPLERAFR